MNFFLRSIRFIRSIRSRSVGRLIRLRDSPIIVCGCPRSGTTLLLAILDAHPEIQAVQQESRIFKKWPYKSDKINRWYHRALISSHLIRFPIKKTARRWAEKTPQNIQYIEEILDEFKTGIKIIHILRDGRDVVTSKHPAQPDRFFVSPEQWSEVVSEGLKWVDHPQVLTIRYESLIQQYQTTVDQIMTFLELEISNEIMEFDKHTSIKTPKSLNNQIQPITDKSIGKWKKEVFKERIEAFNACTRAVSVLEKIEAI